MIVLLVILHANDSFSREGKSEPRRGSRDFLKSAEIVQIEKSILRFTNEERVRNGLRPLKASRALGYIAKKQSINMCDRQLLAHESDAFPEGWRRLVQRLKIANVRSGSENLALRTVESDLEDWARQVVKGWMKSTPHKKNILEPSHKYIGVGIVPCENKIAYATQVFSSDAGSAP